MLQIVSQDTVCTYSMHHKLRKADLVVLD